MVIYKVIRENYEYEAALFEARALNKAITHMGKRNEKHWITKDIIGLIKVRNT